MLKIATKQIQNSKNLSNYLAVCSARKGLLCADNIYRSSGVIMRMLN
jgi:hypothetical protein